MEVREQAQELPHFVGWDKIPEDYYTKTTLSRDFGVKPIDLNTPDATVRAYGEGTWRNLDLYHLDNTKPIKKRKVERKHEYLK